MPASFTASALDKPTRLDRVLRLRFPEWGWQAVQGLIAAGQVTVNGRKVWLASWQIQNGDQLTVAQTPAAKPTPFVQFDESWLIAETAELVVVNKPAGLLSEPTRWGGGANLLELAGRRFGPLVLFHRLDRDTSGVILLTRPGPINQVLDRAFKEHIVKKEYLAIVNTPNQLASAGTITARLAPDPKRRDKMVVVARGGQHAVTHYAIAAERDGRQLVQLWPQTGRTHQLRLHLAMLGAPILGDRLYGPRPGPDQRLLLHALRIDLSAVAGLPAQAYTAPLPPDFW